MGRVPGGNEMAKLNEFEVIEVLEKSFNRISVPGFTVEVDESMPELTIKLPNGQVFNLCVIRVK